MCVCVPPQELNVLALNVTTEDDKWCSLKAQPDGKVGPLPPNGPHLPTVPCAHAHTWVAFAAAWTGSLTPRAPPPPTSPSPVHVCVVQKLGARLKGALPAVEAAVLALSTAELKAFQAAGSMEVAGHLLTTEEVLISREFKGEKTVYDACASPTGHLVVVVNHVVSEELRIMVG